MAYVEIFCLLLFVISIFNLIKRPRIGVNEPPLVPYRFPIIGHTYDFVNDSDGFLKECREKYGEPFSIYVFGYVRTYAGVDSIPEVLRNTDVFDFKMGVNKIAPIGDFLRQFVKINHHKLPRRTVGAAQVVQERIGGKIDIYTPRLQKECLFGIEKYFGDCKEPRVFRNVRDSVARIFAKLTANVILGEECAQFEDIINSFAAALSVIDTMKSVPQIFSFIHPSLHKYFLTLPLKFGLNPFNRHRDLFVKHCKPIVEKRIRQRKELGEKYIEKEDLLDFFISESKTDVVDDNYMNNLFVRVYSMVLSAGTGTIRFLALALFDFSGRPELWKEIYEEQLKIHNESNGDLSTRDVNQMVKLDCFVKESLRYSGDVASIPHIMVGDSYTFSNGVTIPKDRVVYIYMKDTAFSSKFYGKTSNDFQPTRHITSYSDGQIIHSPASKVDKSLVTFGGGKHTCPGRVFAVNTIKIFLHQLILRYNIRTESGKIEPPRVVFSFSYPPSSGLIFENRK